jgi:hypothetical protein
LVTFLSNGLFIRALSGEKSRSAAGGLKKIKLLRCQPAQSPPARQILSWVKGRGKAARLLRLGHFFGTSPEFWLNLQKIFELRLAEDRSWATIKGLPTLSQARKKPGEIYNKSQFKG